jgi:hypothetical protein
MVSSPFLAASGRQKSEEGEVAFTEAVLFGEEFKEIHAAVDPAKMPASK